MVCYFQAVVECVFVRTESLAWPLRRFLVMREVQPGTGEGGGGLRRRLDAKAPRPWGPPDVRGEADSLAVLGARRAHGEASRSRGGTARRERCAVAMRGPNVWPRETKTSQEKRQGFVRSSCTSPVLCVRHRPYFRIQAGRTRDKR